MNLLFRVRIKAFTPNLIDFFRISFVTKLSDHVDRRISLRKWKTLTAAELK